MGFGFRGNLKPLYVFSFLFFFCFWKKATLHLISSNEILKVYVREVKIAQRRRSKLEEEGGGMLVCSPRKIFNLGSRKCHFLHFLQNIFRKQIRRKCSSQLFILPISSVIDKLLCSRGEKQIKLTPLRKLQAKGETSSTLQTSKLYYNAINIYL